MSKPDTRHLSRRERQIMDVVYARGTATAAQVRADLPDPPSDSAVRTMLRLLEEKGHLTHAKDGRRFVYAPVVSPTVARRSALQGVVDTFFAGSVQDVVASLLDMESRRLTGGDLDRLERLIEDARARGATDGEDT